MIISISSNTKSILAASPTHAFSCLAELWKRHSLVYHEYVASW